MCAARFVAIAFSANVRLVGVVSQACRTDVHDWPPLMCGHC